MRAAVAAAQAAEKAAAEKAAAEKAAAEKAAAEKAAAEKAAAEKAAAEKAAAEKAAAEKAAAEKAAAEKAAAEKAAAEKAAAEKAAAEKAAAEKAAAEKAAAEKAAAEKAAAEKAAAEKAAAEKAAAEKAAAEKAAAEKAAAEKAAAEKAAAEKAAAEKAAAEKAAAEKAAAEKAAAEKAAAEKVRVEALRKKAEAEREARDKAQKAKRQPSGSGKQESGEKAALREKAVAEYKDLVTRFPGTAAAAGAAARLREMGVSFDSPVPPQVAAATGNAQVLTLEVGQAADIGFDVRNPQQAGEVSRKVYIPFSVTNRGNGPDSYYLESGFPSAYSAQFAAASRPDRAVNLTPVLAPGESFEGVLSLTVPPTAVDGTKIIYPVKAASQFAREVSQSRDVILVASAPLLRMVLKPDKPQLLPGERVTYRAALLNIGSATATGISIRFNYPPQYEPVDFVPAGFKQEMKAALVMDGLQIKSGEKREYTVQFQLKDEALAQQELFLRGEAVNQDLGTRDSFVSTVSVVRPVSDVLVRSSIGKTMVIPGQVVAIPLIVTNAGNVREDFAIRAKLPERYSHSFFQDMNRDGIRQPNEPVINHVGPLSPREDMYVVMEVSTSATEKDGTEAQLSVDLESENAQGGRASASVRLRFSRPVLELAMAGRGGRLRPGDVNGLELSCMNTGSNMAKNVELESTLPDPVELVASDPPFTAGKGGAYLWRFEELGSGEKRSIKLTYRLKPTAPVGAHLQLKNVLTYQDQLGNRY
ncbi:histone H1-like repetitive region-containing protein [Geobacter sp. DSM 9736]|uniref:histone H1-like repetitive region-containing protein n=1 Tax=Geobacter sp. DSM 9736 TaxID=1277350 RepID=UPI0035175A70